MAGCLITLMPPKLVVRFGDQVSVNCTTSATNISEMGWEASVGATGMKNSSWVTWMVEKLIYWTVQPMCFVNLENGVQCFESPAITVYSEYKSSKCAIHYLQFSSRRNSPIKSLT